MSVREKNRKRKREARKGENRGQGGWRGERRRRTRERKGSCGGRLRNDREKEGERERVRNGVRGGRDAGRRSVGYRSVRVLLQRPTGQRITRNSRLDSAEFERAPADLAFLHRFASLCFALASPRLASPLLSSLVARLSRCWYPLGYRAFPAVSPCVYEKLTAGLPGRLPQPNRNSLLRGSFERVAIRLWPIR